MIDLDGSNLIRRKIDRDKEPRHKCFWCGCKQYGSKMSMFYDGIKYHFVCNKDSDCFIEHWSQIKQTNDSK